MNQQKLQTCLLCILLKFENFTHCRIKDCYIALCTNEIFYITYYISVIYCIGWSKSALDKTLLRILWQKYLESKLSKKEMSKSYIISISMYFQILNVSFCSEKISEHMIFWHRLHLSSLIKPRNRTPVSDFVVLIGIVQPCTNVAYLLSYSAGG